MVLFLSQKYIVWSLVSVIKHHTAACSTVKSRQNAQFQDNHPMHTMAYPVNRGRNFQWTTPAPCHILLNALKCMYRTLSAISLGINAPKFAKICCFVIRKYTQVFQPSSVALSSLIVMKDLQEYVDLAAMVLQQVHGLFSPCSTSCICLLHLDISVHGPWPSPLQFLPCPS
jgi:hypothetical protein